MNYDDSDVSEEDERTDEEEDHEGKMDLDEPFVPNFPNIHESPPRLQFQYEPDGNLTVPKIDTFTHPGLLNNQATAEELFPLQLGDNRQFPRFTFCLDDNTLLIYTDGACLNNGQPNSAAGWGFIFREPEPNHPELGRVSGRVEEHGPTGEPCLQTSNRAELRAVIAALRFRIWGGDGWRRLVIATDSEYTVKGATQWVQAWGRKGWVTRNRTAVKNRDLWEELLQEVTKHQEIGLKVCFWKIPRAWNAKADEAANIGARKQSCWEFRPVVGFMC
jgi:ribonuclease HI